MLVGVEERVLSRRRLPPHPNIAGLLHAFDEEHVAPDTFPAADGTASAAGSASPGSASGRGSAGVGAGGGRGKASRGSSSSSSSNKSKARFLVLPHVPMSLEAEVEKRRRRHGAATRPLFDSDKVVALVALQVAHALMHARAHGLVHRDVRAANVMVGAGMDGTTALPAQAWGSNALAVLTGCVRGGCVWRRMLLPRGAHTAVQCCVSHRLLRFGTALDCVREELDGARIEYRYDTWVKGGQDPDVLPPEVRHAHAGRSVVLDYARQHEWGLGLVLWDMLSCELRPDEATLGPNGLAGVPLPRRFATRRLCVPNYTTVAAGVAVVHAFLRLPLATDAGRFCFANCCALLRYCVLWQLLHPDASARVTLEGAVAQLEVMLFGLDACLNASTSSKGRSASAQRKAVAAEVAKAVTDLSTEALEWLPPAGAEGLGAFTVRQWLLLLFLASDRSDVDAVARAVCEPPAPATSS